MIYLESERIRTPINSSRIQESLENPDLSFRTSPHDYPRIWCGAKIRGP
jgi:hypothetical protein